MVQETVPKSEGNDPLSDPVERLYDDLRRLVEALKLTGKPSLAVSVSETASKSLLMSAASRFEADCMSMFRRVADTRGAGYLGNFAINQGVVRKYHSLFDWEAANANKFFQLFGDELRVAAAQRVEKDTSFAAAVTQFLWIGRKRNELVHSDFVAFPLDNTLEELIDKYRVASRFLPHVEALLSKTSEGNDASWKIPKLGRTTSGP